MTVWKKLYSSITDSSLWAEDPATRVLFVTFMAKSDRDGYLFASMSGLARLANLSLEDTKRSVAKMLSPDLESSDLERNPENEGRRIERISGGWRLLNVAYYRDLQRAEDRRERSRLKKKRQRARRKGRGGQMSPHCPPSSPHIEGELEIEGKGEVSNALDRDRHGEVEAVTGAPGKGRSGSGSSAGGGTASRGKTGTSVASLPRGSRPRDLEEVRAFLALERPDLDAFDASLFFEHFEGSDWKDSSGQPLGDWKKVALAFRYDPPEES